MSNKYPVENVLFCTPSRINFGLTSMIRAPTIRSYIILNLCTTICEQYYDSLYSIHVFSSVSAVQWYYCVALPTVLLWGNWKLWGRTGVIEPVALRNVGCFQWQGAGTKQVTGVITDGTRGAVWSKNSQNSRKLKIYPKGIVIETFLCKTSSVHYNFILYKCLLI